MTRVATFVLLAAVGACGGKKKNEIDVGSPVVGRVKISSVPTGAAVLEGGQRLGKTPLTIERPAAKRIKLMLVKDGFEIYRAKRFVEQNREVRLHAVMRPTRGLLIVRSGLVRGARIFIDGKDQGKTPRRVHVRADRAHRLEVRQSGYGSWATTVTVSSGETLEIEAELVPWGKKGRATGWLTVSTDVPAMVYIGAAPLGSTPLKRIKLPARTYLLTVANPKLKLSRKVSVTLRPREEKKLELKLKK